MNREKLYSLLSDAMEEYGADDIVGVLNNILEDIEIEKAKEERIAKQKEEDAVELYRQVVLYYNTYYPEVLSDEEAAEFMREIESHKKMIVKACDYYKRLFQESKEKAIVPAEAVIEKNDNDWVNVLNNFFDKYNI